MKTISIGKQDFASLRENNCFYIDKMMILASPGQHSCNTRTHIPTTFGQAFLYYPDIHS